MPPPDDDIDVAPAKLLGAIDDGASGRKLRFDDNEVTRKSTPRYSVDGPSISIVTYIWDVAGGIASVRAGGGIGREYDG